MATRKIESVLYVDDDPDICEVVKATLSLVAGLNVHTAGSGERAIDLAYVLRPDLVLMDVMMPGLDGPSTLKRMRTQALLADIPVIFLTAKVLPAEVAQLLQFGALGVIGKPFDPLKLHDDLFTLWDHADRARGPEANVAGRSQVQKQVGSLSDGFLQRTGGDILRLRSIVERARHGDRSALEEAKRIAHSIHGAGAMFGFPELSAAGGALERLVEAVLASAADHNSISEPAVLQRLSDFTGQIARGVDASRQAAQRIAGMFQD